MGNSSFQAASILVLALLQPCFYAKGRDVTHGCFSTSHIAVLDNNASGGGNSMFLRDCGRPVSIGRRSV